MTTWAMNIWVQFARFTLGEVTIVVADVPELMALHGVIQPPAHHPEIDTLRHIALVMEQAMKLTSDPATHFAALLHDLGKGVTPKDLLPHHVGHEDAGVPLIHQVCDRLGNVPDSWRDLAITVSAFHTRCHQITNATPKAMRRFLREIDAYNQPERFERFLVACEADARGRIGFENRDYPQVSILREAVRQIPNPENVEKKFRMMSTSIVQRLREMPVETRLEVFDQFCFECGQIRNECTCG